MHVIVVPAYFSTTFNDTFIYCGRRAKTDTVRINQVYSVQA